MSTKLDFKIREQVGYINFFEENEKHPCTLDYEVLTALDSIIDNAANNEELRVIIIQSHSPKYFVVGANIEALQTLTPQSIFKWVDTGHRIFRKISSLPVPVIAVVRGYVLGGGLELAMSADMIFATENARFGQPEASLGVITGWGASFRLPQRIGFARANEMLFTGKIIHAREAYDIGLVNHAVTDTEMDSLLEETIASIKKNDPLSVALTKQIIYSSSNSGLDNNHLFEAITSSLCLYSPGTQKRMKDFFNSRKNNQG